MPTLKQVATLAGVSVATASKVLNKSPAASEISAQTQELVLRTAREVNYTPHPIAHSLRTNRTHTIGFISPYMPETHLSPILRSVQKLLDSRGYGLLISVTERSAEREAHWIEFFRHRVDGLIVSDKPGPEVEDIGARLHAEKIAAVLIERESTAPGIPSVTVDGTAGVRRAVEHLVKLGHKRIAFLGGRPDSYDNQMRFGGYKAGLEAAGIPLSPDLIVENGSMEDYCYARARQLISEVSGLTAIITFNDSMAMGTIRAAVESGRRVPDDISIVGFDDLAWAAHICPPLTTVRQPREAVGIAAATLLLELIARRDAGGKSGKAAEGKCGQNVVLDAELVVRASTGPARR